MKTAVLLMCLTVSAFSLSPQISIREEWLAYKSKFDKVYETSEEDNFRFKTFLKNKHLIGEHNKRYDAGEVTYTLGINKFADMLPEEFKAYRGYNGVQQLDPLVPIHKVRKTQALPDAVDWRPLGYVTPVKDQGECGSCWAFSATGSLEGQHFAATGELVSLSEQNLVDCDRPINAGCHGGITTMAYRYIKNNGGIDTEISYPYIAHNQKCQFMPENIGATDTGFKYIESEDEDSLQDAVVNIGPISVAIDASHPNFHFYESGVYSNAECSTTKLDHGVLVVGYGTTEEGEDFWIVKNSWGIGWGMDGYFNLARNVGNMCGVATAASYPTV